MNHQLTAVPVIEEYERNGFVIFPGAISQELIAEARGHVTWLQQRHPGLRPEHFHHPLMRDDAFWVRLVTDNKLLDIAERFLGPDLACFTSHYICKPPMDGQAVLWHQDGAYWHLQPLEALTVWLALDDCDTENGCLRMIPGTHRCDLGEVVLRRDVPNMLYSSIDPRSVNDESAVDVPLRAGDVSVHHPRIIHGSEPNRSLRRRCGLDIGYIPTSTRIGNTGLYLNPILARGRAIDGVNRYRPWPRYHPDRTVPFSGCAEWNERARAMNRRTGVVASVVDDYDVGTQTLRVIERLKAGTMKAVRTHR